MDTRNGMYVRFKTSSGGRQLYFSSELVYEADMLNWNAIKIRFIDETTVKLSNSNEQHAKKISKSKVNKNDLVISCGSLKSYVDVPEGRIWADVIEENGEKKVIVDFGESLE